MQTNRWFFFIISYNKDRRKHIQLAMLILYQCLVLCAGCNKDHRDWQDQGRLCSQEPVAWGTAHAPAAPPQYHPAVRDHEVQQPLLFGHGGCRGRWASFSRQKWFKGEETVWGSHTVFCETASVCPLLPPLHWHCAQVRRTAVYLCFCQEALQYSKILLANSSV